MHISDQVAQALLNDDWVWDGDLNGSLYEAKFTKVITFPELAGTISDGTRLVTLTICERGRYLSRVDGWGKVELDVDLRDFPNEPHRAIDAVLKV